MRVTNINATRKGITVYRTYKEQSAEDVLTFWYALTDDETGETDFDIRTLPEAAGMNEWITPQADIKAVLRAAIDAGHLTAAGVHRKARCPACKCPVAICACIPVGDPQEVA